MIALQVKLNGKRVCTAGAEDLSVLSTTVTAVGPLGTQTLPARPREEAEIHYSVRGLTGRQNQATDEHLLWQPLTHLKVGDVITIKVLETERADAPSSSQPVDRRGRGASGPKPHRGRAQPGKPKSAVRLA
jgi:flagellar basal body L-ring protein FlgH